jgi:hypothetical protein
MTRLMRSKLTLAVSTFLFLLIFARPARTNQLVWCETLGKYVPATYTTKSSYPQLPSTRIAPTPQSQTVDHDRIINRTVRFHNLLHSPSRFY